MVHQNRLSHALLFLGKEGSGALPLALAFAGYVNLSSYSGSAGGSASVSLFGEADANPNDQPSEIKTPSEADAWMQQHPGWSKVSALVHPDIHFSYPVIPKKSGDKPISTDYIREWREFIRQYPYGNNYDWLQFIGAENKQGNITVNECNDIIHKLSLKSFESRYKILLMWLPEYLGKEGNRLLKLIEEPPEDTLFILVAENEELILPTILSRTQLVKVPALESKDIEIALAERGKLTATQARQIALISEGNYREALQLLQHSGDDWQGLIRDWLNVILKTDLPGQVKWIEEISRMGREKQKQFLLYFNHLLQQAIRVAIIPGISDQLPETELDFVKRLNKRISIHQHQAIIEELDQATYYIERNANAKLLFHALTIKFYHIIAKNEIVEMK
ncbi:MAG: hypothetical protein M9933_04160 [Chitinophagaceae bacterium]|nr:hypothetical protein [Chitinophagaceae bacterium]